MPGEDSLEPRLIIRHKYLIPSDGAHHMFQPKDTCLGFSERRNKPYSWRSHDVWHPLRSLKSKYSYKYQNYNIRRRAISAATLGGDTLDMTFYENRFKETEVKKVVVVMPLTTLAWTPLRNTYISGEEILVARCVSSYIGLLQHYNFNVGNPNGLALNPCIYFLNRFNSFRLFNVSLFIAVTFVMLQVSLKPIGHNSTQRACPHVQGVGRAQTSVGSGRFDPVPVILIGNLRVISKYCSQPTELLWL